MTEKSRGEIIREAENLIDSEFENLMGMDRDELHSYLSDGNILVTQKESDNLFNLISRTEDLI